jgi:uncharacterized protein
LTGRGQQRSVSLLLLSGNERINAMTIASALLKRHFETMVDEKTQWEVLIADDIVWELPFAPALGHPGRLSGREAVFAHINWFRGAVENFAFFDIRIHEFADATAAVAEVRAEGRIKATGRVYQQEYVLFLRAAGGKIAFLREYFDPTRAAKAMDQSLVDVQAEAAQR